jgi:hypothetical protein
VGAIQLARRWARSRFPFSRLGAGTVPSGTTALGVSTSVGVSTSLFGAPASPVSFATSSAADRDLSVPAARRQASNLEVASEAARRQVSNLEVGLEAARRQVSNLDV